MKFSEITGQTRLKNLFVQSVRNNRVSHAQLLAGPPGSGKLALALAFAQFISCEHKVFTPGESLKGDSCGTCPSCVKYAKLAHPDLHFFFPVAPLKDLKKPMSKDFLHHWRSLLPEKDFLIDLNEWYERIGLENKQGIINAEDCNEMTRILSYKAYESEYKVVIIWHAEKMYHAAAPKILKILEEPPDKTLFLLISDNTDLMLNTILSRTQMVKVPRYTHPDVVAYIRSKTAVSEAQAHKIAVLSDGDMKLASLLAEDTGEEDENYVSLRQWFLLCWSGDVIQLAPFVDQLSKAGREKHKSLLRYGLRIVRRCMLMNYRLDTLVKLEGAEQTFVQKLAAFITPSNVDEITDLFDRSVYYVERNANSKILFMNISLQLAMLFKKK